MQAMENVFYVGIAVAKFVDWLERYGTPLKSFHLIGYSLGGHLIGIAGRNIKNGKIPYITALDPAYPFWENHHMRLALDDAIYVEVIHTNSGKLGWEAALGDADFYPNLGKCQPGCIWLPQVFSYCSCSHAKAYELFADSIGHDGFVAYKCTDYDEMRSGRCANSSQTKMGGSEPKNASGVYYLETNSEKPFYKDVKYYNMNMASNGSS
ncbi:pancreatic lipase-related protein 3-like [Arctopsyche grandis]|uniref:pancreatic lipase-related protein 3-like n=1 Tax=Arctopsyche grandis TaxID=121162 RepID=UPI00406D93DB